MGVGYKKRVSLTKAEWDQVLERLAVGEAWSQISREPEMPCYSAIYARADRNRDFAARFAKARVMAADSRADEALEVIREGGTPAQKANLLMTQAARMNGKRWGVKAETEPQAEAPVLLQIVRHEKVTLEDGSVVVRKVSSRRKVPS